MANANKDTEKEKRLLENKSVKNYMKYSGMAFQIVAYVLVGVFVGKQLDKLLDTSRPYFTALCSILFLSAFFIKLVRDLSQND